MLRYAYELAPADICAALRGLFGLKNVALGNAQRVALALSGHEAGLDFADAFHLAHSQGQEALKTFDGDFIKRARKLSSGCRVEKP